MSRSRIRWVVGSLLTLAALGVVAFHVSTAVAEDTIKLSSHIAGDSKPVVIHADEIVTWVEGSQRLFLVRGTVLVEHGIILARMQEGVLRLDLEREKRTGIAYLDLYGEGGVQVETGLKMQKGVKALIDFSTRGELHLRAHKGPVIQQPRPNDPLYQRFLAAKNEVPPPTGPILRTSGMQPAPNVAPAPGALPMQNTLPGPGVPGNPNPFVPPAPPAGPAPPTPPVTPVTPVVPPPNPPPAGPAAGAPQAGAPTPPSRPSAPGPPRQISISQRTAAPFQTQTFPLPTGEHALVITGGVIVTVRNVENIGLLDIVADRVVVWTRDNPQKLFNNLKAPSGETTRDLEFYLAGNVEVRNQSGPETRTLRADEVYYNVGHNIAVALHADVEFKQPKLPDPMHLTGDEILQLSANRYEAIRARLFSSKLPSDPGLTINVQEGTLEEKQIPKRSIFGREVIDRETGRPETVPQQLFRGESVVINVEQVPVFWLPFIQGDAHDPLGPLQNVNLSYNRIFGFQAGATLNMYDLLGIEPLPGTRWRADVDYLTSRGPALGTQYDYAGKDMFDIPNHYNGIVKAYGILDDGTDVLGGGRGTFDDHPYERGRLLWRQNTYDLPEGFTVQTQLALISDKNFLEQYFPFEFNNDINQDTTVYVKWQHDSMAATLLVEPRLRDWVTETEALPRADGYLIGESFFDLFTYNARASAGYFQLRPAAAPPPPPEITIQNNNTGRFDLGQDLSLPFYLGAFKIVPYAVLDLTYYTEDLEGNDRGRFYGGGGVRASLPLTRLYPDIQSDLLNLNGINHKIVVSANYYNAWSNTPFTLLPQLDLLNDEASEQSLADIKPLEPLFDPAHGVFLATSPLFSPQVYAIQRLLDSRIDTEDTIEEADFDIRQRWQTKRGYPGQQHIVDWMTLDLSASFFPHANRDNFGETVGILSYDWIWNVGDRTALVSSGWMDPVTNGPRVFDIGAFFNRPDRTSYYLGYRQIDPVNSRALTGAVTYVFSPKYALTAASTYDFGFGQSLSNSLVLTRMGSDLQVSFGITYNAILNTFGVTFMIIPNVVPQTQRYLGNPAFGSSLLGR